MPKVSIILPTYKRPVLLRRTVESVFKQIHTDWELIIVNDGDTDFKEEWKDDRIKYFHLHENSGCVSIPRNIGILYSKGEYICPLDDDVLITKERLRVSVTTLDITNYMLVYGSQLRQNQRTKQYVPINISNYNPLKGWGIDTNQIMYRKSVYDKIKIRFPRRACDWELMKDIWAEYPNSFGHMNELVSLYEWHGKNRSLDETTKTKNIYPEKFKDKINWDLVDRNYNIDWTT